jgi:5'-3' exoribonuclease 2
MAVLPKQSSHALPICFRHLFSDPSSEIIDFYPTNFRLDVNGARYEWMGVNLLPFIDRVRLVKAMNNSVKDLNEVEIDRNTLGKTVVFMKKKENEVGAIA